MSCRVVRIQLAQHLDDAEHECARVAQRGPHVRVRSEAGRVARHVGPVTRRVVEHEGVQVEPLLTEQHEVRVVAQVRAGQPHRAVIEREPDTDVEVRVLESHRITRAGGVGVRVGAGRDERADRDALAADPCDEVGERRHGGRDAQHRFRRVGGRRRRRGLTALRCVGAGAGARLGAGARAADEPDDQQRREPRAAACCGPDHARTCVRVASTGPRSPRRLTSRSRAPARRARRAAVPLAT